MKFLIIILAFFAYQKKSWAEVDRKDYYLGYSISNWPDGPNEFESPVYQHGLGLQINWDEINPEIEIARHPKRGIKLSFFPFPIDLGLQVSSGTSWNNWLINEWNVAASGLLGVDKDVWFFSPGIKLGVGLVAGDRNKAMQGGSENGIHLRPDLILGLKNDLLIPIESFSYGIGLHLDVHFWPDDVLVGMKINLIRSYNKLADWEGKILGQDHGKFPK